LDKAWARLQLLGPGNVLARGYSITTDEATGQILRSAEETSSGRYLRTRLGTGEVRSRVSGASDTSNGSDASD
jgi:exonuclease VII large subunit